MIDIAFLNTSQYIVIPIIGSPVDEKLVANLTISSYSVSFLFEPGRSFIDDINRFMRMVGKTPSCFAGAGSVITGIAIHSSCIAATGLRQGAAGAATG
jgi:hypothetical protein